MRTRVLPPRSRHPSTPRGCGVYSTAAGEVAFGVTFSETDAHQQAQIALEARTRKLGYHWEVETGGGWERWTPDRLAALQPIHRRKEATVTPAVLNPPRLPGRRR